MGACLLKVSLINYDTLMTRQPYPRHDCKNVVNIFEKPEIFSKIFSLR
jgi:hypothetical protein